VRTDKRSLEQCRKTIVAHSDNSVRAAVGTADGSALVKLGATVVLCGITLEVGVPFATAPKEGRLAVDVHLGAACSPRFEAGRASEQVRSFRLCVLCVRVRARAACALLRSLPSSLPSLSHLSLTFLSSSLFFSSLLFSARRRRRRASWWRRW
jgi:hypothetical protein